MKSSFLLLKNYINAYKLSDVYTIYGTAFNKKYKKR